MPTIPTGKLERELRALYLRWLSSLRFAGGGVTPEGWQSKLSYFERQALDLIEREGGRVAALGSLADFPAPKRLDLSPYAGKVYNEMQQASISAGIIAGMGSRETAQKMFRAGMDKSYRKLERLARTETVSAYWKNSWDSIADLPALVMIWGSETSPRTCEWCRERDGLVMEDPKLRDHPNGRCTPIPTLRSQVKYRGSLDADGNIYQNPEWARSARKRVEESTPVKTVPKSAATSEAQYDARTVWPKATERDLPFSRLLDSEDPIVERALSSYQMGGYRTMNGALRRGLKTDETLTARINALRQVTSETTTKDLTLNRGMGSLDFLGAEFKKPDFDTQTLVGKSFKDKGFDSTSYAGDIPLVDFDEMPVQLEILAPKGTRGSLLGNDEEREFLLAPDTTFTILDAVRAVDGKLRVRVAITSQGKK